MFYWFMKTHQTVHQSCCRNIYKRKMSEKNIYKDGRKEINQLGIIKKVYYRHSRKLLLS